MAVTSKSMHERPITERHADTQKWDTPLLSVIVYVLALAAIVVLIGHTITWGQRTVDNVRYGMPRRVHLSGYVGHNDAHAMPTHFIALNLDGHVSVLEIPGGDIERLTVLPGPYVVGHDGPYVVPELALRDLDSNGHVDLLVTLRGETVVYMNDNGGFRLMTPGERARLMEIEDGSGT